MLRTRDLEPSGGEERFTDVELVEARKQELSDNVFAPLAIRQGYNYMQQMTLDHLSNGLQSDQTIDLPTRAGKSHLIRDIAAEAATSGHKTAIITHRRLIVDEHCSSLESRLGEYPGTLLDDQPSYLTVDTLQSLLANKDVLPEQSGVDLLLIDEAHRALGEVTREVIRKLFPNAVRAVFTATPDFAEDRSVTDEYGEKIVSKSPIEAIEAGIVSPIRIFVYKTDGVIDNLDPSWRDFSPRELKKLADFLARNKAMADFAEDLVNKGRQGLIRTIPGENLLHADNLKAELSGRLVDDGKGGKRLIRVEVVKGSRKGESDQIIDDFEAGYIDVVLYNKLWLEGVTLKKASFFINGCPTTSIVDLTQALGRVLEPNDLDAIAIDFVDQSMGKKQRTLLEVLGMDRTVQGVKIGPPQASDPVYEIQYRDTYLRGLFRGSLSEALKSIDQTTIAELLYSKKELEELTPYQRSLRQFRAERKAGFKKEQKKWDKTLQKEGLEPNQPDYFGAEGSVRGKAWSALTDEYQDAMTNGAGAKLWEREVYRYKDESPLDFVLGAERSARIVVPPVVSSSIIQFWANSTSDGVSTEADGVFNEVAVGIMKNNVHQALLTLGERSRGILEERFGINRDADQKTYEEIGDIYGVTRERVRQVEAQAAAQLRHPQTIRNLESFVRDRNPERVDEYPRHDPILRDAILRWERDKEAIRNANPMEMHRSLDKDHISNTERKLMGYFGEIVHERVSEVYDKLSIHLSEAVDFVATAEFKEALSTFVSRNYAVTVFANNGWPSDDTIRLISLDPQLPGAEEEFMRRLELARNFVRNYHKNVASNYQDVRYAAWRTARILCTKTGSKFPGTFIAPLDKLIPTGK